MPQARLSFDDGLFLETEADLFALGELANIVRERNNGNVAYYNVNEHLNPTNIYTNVGPFSVTLTAIGAGGTNSVTQTNYITVTPGEIEFSTIRRESLPLGWRVGGGTLSPSWVPGSHQRPTSVGFDGFLTSQHW